MKLNRNKKKIGKTKTRLRFRPLTRFYEVIWSGL